MTFIINFFFKTKNQSLKVLSYLAVHWKSLVIIIVPVLLSPLFLVPGKEAKCACVILLMAFYWMTEALPLPVTSLIPIVLLPLFNILSTEKTCLIYFKETNVMFLGGVIMAIAIEQSNLHKRIALKVLLMMGTSPRRLLLGFMLTTMFLSMWICNSAATSLMIPVVFAVLDELQTCENDDNESGNPKTISDGVELSVCDNDISNATATRRQSDSNLEKKRNINNFSKEKNCYFLGVAYAANIGGTGTLTGTATNLMFKGTFESLYPEANEINFANWMKFNVILMLLNTFLAWIWLQILYMSFGRKNQKATMTKDVKNRVESLIRESYTKLGPMTYREGSVFLLFILDVLLWLLRKPEFIGGWEAFFPENEVKDATSAIAVAILLFILPADLNFLKLGVKKKSPPLLDWKVACQKIPFGIILLLGGGFAISEASKASGLSDFISKQLNFVENFSPTVILSFVVLATTFITEISSNTAVASIILPVLAKTSSAIKLNPLHLMMPATISCSYAFMLPVATPPNAIVAVASNIKTIEMVRAGIGMNLICVASLIVSFIYVAVPMYGLTTFPDWAKS